MFQWIRQEESPYMQIISSNLKGGKKDERSVNKDKGERLKEKDKRLKIKKVKSI